MYAKLNYNPSVNNSGANVLGNIVALMTGAATTVGALTGTDIDTASSEIDTSYAVPAYVLYDDISATNKVLEGTVHDDPSSKFYIEFTVSGADIDIELWEGWDAVTTHAGTGEKTYFTTTGFEFASTTTAASFTLYLSITARHCVCSTVGAGNDTFRGFVQYDRLEGWDTVAAGSKPVALRFNNTFATTSQHFYALPFKTSAGNLLTQTLAYLYVCTRIDSSQNDILSTTHGNTAGTSRTINEAGDSIHPMYEMGLSRADASERFQGGKIHDMYLTTYQHGAQGDLVSVGGNTYVIWDATNYRVAIRRG